MQVNRENKKKMLENQTKEMAVVNETKKRDNNNLDSQSENESKTHKKLNTNSW